MKQALEWESGGCITFEGAGHIINLRIVALKGHYVIQWRRAEES